MPSPSKYGRASDVGPRYTVRPPLPWETSVAWEEVRATHIRKQIDDHNQAKQVQLGTGLQVYR